MIFSSVNKNLGRTSLNVGKDYMWGYLDMLP